MKELLQAGVPVPVAMKAARQSGNFSDDDAQHIIARQQAALILMTMILDDVRRSIPQLGQSLDRIIQQAIDNAGTGLELAERLEQETWGVDAVLSDAINSGTGAMKGGKRIAPEDYWERDRVISDEIRELSHEDPVIRQVVDMHRHGGESWEKCMEVAAVILSRTVMDLRGQLTHLMAVTPIVQIPENWKIGVDWAASHILRKQAEATTGAYYFALDEVPDAPQSEHCRKVLNAVDKYAHRLRQQADEMDGK